MKIRQEILILYLSYLFRPTPLSINASLAGPCFIVIKDDQPGQLGESILYNLQNGQICRCTNNWMNCLGELRARRGSYEEFCKHHENLIKNIPFNEWFFESAAEHQRTNETLEEIVKIEDQKKSDNDWHEKFRT